jgi:two-component system cell cycle sensor histidine kinase/response regulator CckA
VTLSATARHGDEPADPATPPASGHSPVGDRPAHILVVDDDAVVRALARTILERAGYRVTVAADGDEALDTFQQGEGIDLVLLDYLMPGPNGLEVYQELARRRPGVRVIFISGYVKEADHAAILGSAGQPFLPKPYRPKELVALVQRVLSE